jgi:hypothetical protein
MENLTQQEREIFNHKKKVLYNRLSTINHRNMPIIHNIIDKGLTNLIKNNHSEFVNGTYIDYIENEVRDLIEYSETWVARRKLYRKFFTYKDEESFQKSMLIYARYLLHIFHRSQCGYYSRVVYDDNERVLNLTKDIKESIGPYKDGIERYAFANAHEKLMAYILSQNDLLIDRDKYMELIDYFRNNFSYFYDHFMMNYEEGYMVQNISQHFFDAKEFVLEYQNKPYRKTIE